LYDSDVWTIQQETRFPVRLPVEESLFLMSMPRQKKAFSGSGNIWKFPLYVNVFLIK
jgi:hypothetical protein